MTIQDDSKTGEDGFNIDEMNAVHALSTFGEEDTDLIRHLTEASMNLQKTNLQEKQTSPQPQVEPVDHQTSSSQVPLPFFTEEQVDTDNVLDDLFETIE